VVDDKVREVDQKFQVREKTKLAFAVAVAEQKVSSVGSGIMKNYYIYINGDFMGDGGFRQSC
jgi:hypothetical protein